MGGRQHIARRLAAVAAKFLAVGALSTLIEIVAFNVLVFLVGMDPVAAKLLASLIALVNAWVGNRQWAFKDRGGDQRAQLGRFLVVNLVCAVLGATLLASLVAVLTYQLGLDGALWLNLSNFVAIGVVVVVRFGLYHLWVFRARPPLPDQPLVERVAYSWAGRTVLVAAVCSVSFLYALAVAPFNGFVDEYDNILGGWLLLNRGELPYTGYFSHHMPLGYFAAVPLLAMVGADLVLFRIAFAIALFAWLLLIYRTAERSLGWIAGLVLVVGTTALSLSTMSSALLAETLIAYAVIHAVVLLAGHLQFRRRAPTIRDTAVIAVVGAVPALSSLSYAVVSLVIYGWFAVLVAQEVRRRREPLRIAATRLLPVVAWLAGPWVVFAAYLLVTGSFGRFVEQAYSFNTAYYSQFVGDVADGIGPTLVANVTSFFQAYGVALLGGPTIAQILAQLLAVGVIPLLGALVAVRAAWLLPPLVLLVVFGSYRNWAVARAFGDPSARYMVYFALVVVIAALVVGIALARRTEDLAPRRPRLVAALVVAALVLAVPLAGAARATIGLGVRVAAGEDRTIAVAARNPAIGVANAVLTTRDDYFVGPFDFATQMYLHGSRTSIYTFVLPWHGACDPCMAELEAELEAEAPLVVIWDAPYVLWGHAAAEYASEVQDLLDRRYFQVDAPGASDVYFLESERDLVLTRLEDAGIPAELVD